MESPLVCSDSNNCFSSLLAHSESTKVQRIRQGSCLHSLGTCCVDLQCLYPVSSFLHVPAAIMFPRNFPCPFCGLCFVRLGPHLPRCRQREGRDYSAFLAKAPVPPAREVCSTCGRRFKRLDTHLRVSSTCRVIFPSVPIPSPNVPSPSMNSISQTAVSTQARRIFKVDRALLARSAATRGVWGHDPPPPKILGF